jgi:hypothetical protein
VPNDPIVGLAPVDPPAEAIIVMLIKVPMLGRIGFFQRTIGQEKAFPKGLIETIEVLSIGPKPFVPHHMVPVFGNGSPPFVVSFYNGFSGIFQEAILAGFHAGSLVDPSSDRSAKVRVRNAFRDQGQEAVIGVAVVVAIVRDVVNVRRVFLDLPQDVLVVVRTWSSAPFHEIHVVGKAGAVGEEHADRDTFVRPAFEISREGVPQRQGILFPKLKNECGRQGFADGGQLEGVFEAQAISCVTVPVAVVSSVQDPPFLSDEDRPVEIASFSSPFEEASDPSDLIEILPVPSWWNATYFGVGGGRLFRSLVPAARSKDRSEE